MNYAVYGLSRIETSPSGPSEINAHGTPRKCYCGLGLRPRPQLLNSTSTESLGRLSHLGPSWEVSILYMAHNKGAITSHTAYLSEKLF